MGLGCNIVCICGILSNFKELFLTPTESRDHIPSQGRSRSPSMTFAEKKQIFEISNAKNQGCVTLGHSGGGLVQVSGGSPSASLALAGASLKDLIVSSPLTPVWFSGCLHPSSMVPPRLKSFFQEQPVVPLVDLQAVNAVDTDSLFATILSKQTLL